MVGRLHVRSLFLVSVTVLLLASCAGSGGEGEQTGDVREAELAVVTSPPLVSSFSPQKGLQGASVTITGKNFVPEATVAFGDLPAAAVTYVSATKLAAIVPAGATTGHISVTTPLGTATSAADYGIVPSVTAFEPEHGVPGDNVTVTGTGFTGVTNVRFGTREASFTIVNDTTLTTTVPDGVASAKINVVSPFGTKATPTSFVLEKQPKVTSFAPATGALPLTVTLTGSGFIGVDALTLGGAPLTDVVVASGTSLTATIPLGTPGGKFVVTNSAGTATSSQLFTVIDRCADVVCAASDACHVAGVCDGATGLCSTPAAPDGTVCSDGNACTQSDVCAGGTCTGENPVLCAAMDVCHLPGVCDSTTGACTNPAAEGVCGCGALAVDGDGDGLYDCEDVCPTDPGNDPDGDGWCASQDNCPTVANADQANADGDTRGDRCDAAPADSIAAGGYSSCAIREGGKVYCWGYNGWGTLGDGTTTNSPTPVQVVGITDAVQVAGGYAKACARRATGEVRCWGYPTLDGSNQIVSTPAVVPYFTDAVSVAVGGEHICAVRATGEVVCWSDSNWDGQLGNSLPLFAPWPPWPVYGLTDAVAVTAGDRHACALRRTGQVSCWGYGADGQLGYGSTENRSSPVAVSGLTNVTSLAAGANVTCARRSTSDVWCWGAAASLGNGAAANSSVPVFVPGLGATAVTAGYGFVCARQSTGTLKCWGDQAGPRVPYEQVSVAPTPVAISGLPTPVVAASVGIYHVCTLDDLGAIRCFGSASNFQLGNGIEARPTTPVVVPGATTQVSVAASYAHTCALGAAGNVLCWGEGANGALGNGTNVGSNVPVTVTGLSGVTSLDLGYFHSCALLAGGSAKCWGWGFDGQLGNGTLVDAPVPVAVAGLAGATALSVGRHHSCALLPTGSVTCWGSGANGALGNGATARSAVPVVVSGIADAIAVSAGGNYSCAVHANGDPACWGGGASGQLGSGSMADQLTPVLVTDLHGVAGLATGTSHTCARLTDGTVQCWGNGARGRLGNGATTSSNLPVIVPGLSGVIDVQAGNGHTCALLDTRELRCWGSGTDGQLGNGTYQDALVPSAVATSADVAKVAVGDTHTCIVTTGGATKCWGNGLDGQLGNGAPWFRVPVQVPSLPGL